MTAIQFTSEKTMSHIKITDEIVLNSSVEDIWNILIDIPRYQKWWPKIVNLKVLKLTNDLIGTEFQASPFGGKSFSCKVISLIPKNEIRLSYFDGIYTGEGVWKVERKENFVKVSYSVDLKIVDKSIALLSRIIPIPKLHSMIFKRIMVSLQKQIN
jgi:ribosome-associated toxin RatA of RatAB toxin-antitoxin module